MSIYEKTMFVSMLILFFLYYYIKIILKINGHKIHLLFDYGKDYTNFKNLIELENNTKKKQKFITIIFLLKIFGVILVVSTVAGIIMT